MSGRRVAEKALDEHAVLPLAVEPAVTALDPDLLEARRQMRRVEAFSRWSAAETAAGLTATPSRRDRRLGRGLQLLLGRPARRLALR